MVGPERIAIVQLLVKYSRLYAEQAEVRRQRAALDQRDQGIQSGISDCFAGLRAFGIVIVDDESWHRVIDEFGNEVNAALNPPGREQQFAEQIADAMTTMEDAIATMHTEPGPRSIKTAAPMMPRVRDYALDYLRARGETGAKAAEVRRWVEARQGKTLHPKTAGMTLYRLLGDGLVRRAGHTWFFVPPKADMKNPGVGAPGSEDASTRKEDT